MKGEGRGSPGVGARAPVVRRPGAAPLWRQVLDDVRARLDAGEFTEGGLPGELALAEQYSVSRHTVREALRRLRAEGIVAGVRGRRPRAVSGPVIQQPSGLVYSLFSAVESSGLEQVSVVRALEVRADGVIAPRLGLEESTPLLFLERLRLAGGEPLALDRVWLPASLGESLLDVDFTHTSFYEELLTATGIPVTGGEETVRAVIPTAAEHRLLGVEPPAAALSVERLGASRGVPVEWRHTLIRADRFELRSALVPVGVGDPVELLERMLVVTPTFG